MKKNLEVKAYCDNPDDLRSRCQDTGAHLVRSDAQTDTYYFASHGHLKLRQSSSLGAQLIYYQRRSEPGARESTFSLMPLPGDGKQLDTILTAALGQQIVITKERTTFRLGPVLINLDQLPDLGAFVELEVEEESVQAPDTALGVAERTMRMLGLALADTVPWSYSELAAMTAAARRHRDMLRHARPGTAFLIDGASGSGKTSLARRLLARPELNLTFVPRHTTRAPRPNATDSDYRFVTDAEFRKLASAGEFIEYRDFLFGMSYGLAWRPVLDVLLTGRHVLGIVDLGTARHIKQVFPEAVTILVDCPPQDIERRLRARGIHTDDQIQERLTNARAVAPLKRQYHHVLNNADGRMDAAEEMVARLITEGVSPPSAASG